MEKILEIRNLKTYFQTSDGLAKAVDGIDFFVLKGETLGLVGESGCGKSVTAHSILRLFSENQHVLMTGEVLFEGRNLFQLTNEEMRQIRGNEISMVFQEPMTSLNPVFTIGNQIIEAITLHQKVSKKEALEKAVHMLKLVGIPAPEKRIYAYPHQLSGGMRQRAMIAMALSCNPKILIADEPTTALDVTIQAQILELMLKLKDELGMSIILITHDLGIIAETAQRVIVMYAGRIMETAPVEELFSEPKNPYTIGLLKSLPRLGTIGESRKKTRLQEIPGIVPSAFDIPGGCRFSPRCPFVMPICKEKEPDLIELHKEHECRCWLHQEHE